MVFDAREAAKSLPTEPFEFIGMDGDTYDVPNMSTLTGAQAELLVQGDMSVLKGVAHPEAYEALMAMPVALQKDFARAWVAHSRASGKEASRSSSTRPRAKRSK